MAVMLIRPELGGARGGEESWAGPAVGEGELGGPTLWGARVSLTLGGRLGGADYWGARVALTSPRRSGDGTSRGARVSWTQPAGALG